MASEESKDSVNIMDWKKVCNATASGSSVPITKKRLPKKIRQVPDYYFLPRRSLPSAFAFYGACCAAGVGAGMILEVWIKKKIKVALLRSSTLSFSVGQEAFFFSTSSYSSEPLMVLALAASTSAAFAWRNHSAFFMVSCALAAATSALLSMLKTILVGVFLWICRVGQLE